MYTSYLVYNCTSTYINIYYVIMSKQSPLNTKKRREAPWRSDRSDRSDKSHLVRTSSELLEHDLVHQSPCASSGLQPSAWAVTQKMDAKTYNFLASSHCSHESHVQKLRQAATWQGSPHCSQPTLSEAIIKFDCILLHGTRRLFLSLGTLVTL